MDPVVAHVKHDGIGNEREAQVCRWVIDPVRGLVVSRPAALMGILNVTPDSFSDGGRHLAVAAAVAAGLAMVAAGAAWLDVGGESSRPGAQEVSLADECARVVPVIAALRAAGITVPISVDTTKASVAEAALRAGASAVNDISAGGDPAMFPLLAAQGCPVVLMHMQGDPRTMQVAPHYHAVVAEVCAVLARRMEQALAAGVSEDAILLDPGIGFGKTLEHNRVLLRALPHLNATFGRPLLLGVSRKSFISGLLGRGVPVGERDAASHVLHALIAGECALLRVHDVIGARDALALARALGDDRQGGPYASA